MKFLFWLLALPLALVILVFAVVNRQTVGIDVWPLPWQMQIPAYFLVLGPLALGVLIGGVMAWLSGTSVRRRARDEARRANQLDYELSQVKAMLASRPVAPPEPSPPARRRETGEDSQDPEEDGSTELVVGNRLSLAGLGSILARRRLR